MIHCILKIKCKPIFSACPWQTKLTACKDLWLFSHDGKVRILNRDSRCASWVTQCTHDRPVILRILNYAVYTWATKFWILHVWVPCQSNMHGARISCASVHTCMQLAVYRRKWLEGHTSSAPKKHDLEVKSFIHRFCCVICENRNWKTPLDRDLRCAFQITFRDVIWHTHSLKYRLLNFNTKCAFRIKIQTTHFAVVWKQSICVLEFVHKGKWKFQVT